MSFHLGKKEFIENLSSDVLDIDHTMKRLFRHLPSSSQEPILHSWKYPGTSYRDVDTQNLINCFRFNPRSSLEECRKAHLIMTELLVDRLMAFIFICASIMDKQIVSGERNLFVFEKRFPDKNTIKFVADYFGNVYRAFLMAWGIGLQKCGALTDSECQTFDQFKPHNPCLDCSRKINWMQTTASLLGHAMDLPAEYFEEKETEENLKKLYDTSAINHKNILQTKQNLEEINADLKKNISLKLAEVKDKQRMLEKLQKDSSHATMEKKARETLLKYLEMETEKVQGEIETQTKENRNMDENFQMVLGNYGNLEKKLACCETKMRARKRVYELSTMAMQEKNNALLATFEKMNERIGENEQCYDPMWQSKLREAEEKMSSLRDTWNHSKDLLQFNEIRVAGLKQQHEKLILQRENL